MRCVVVLLAACSSPAPVAAPLSHHVPARPARPAICSEGRLIEERYSTMPVEREPRVTGSLDKELIQRVIRAKHSELQQCYATYLERGTQAGRVVAQFTIVGEGRVGQAWVTGFDGALANCVCEVVAQMQFLSTRGRPITITYPFSFAPAP